MNKRILHLAIPNIATNIVIPLLALVDLGLIGHLDNLQYIGAIALGNMVLGFLFWGFSFLRMGTSGFAAQSYGERNFTECFNILIRALATAIAAGLLLILLQYPIGQLAFQLVHGTPAVESLAQDYFNIRIFAAIPALCMYVFVGWFIGMQNARIPMIIVLVVNSLNILLSCLFILVLGMKCEGVALSYVLSQYVGLVLGGYFIYRYIWKFRFRLNIREAFQRSAFPKFFKVNANIFVRTLCLIAVLSFFTISSTNQGDITLATNSLLFQFFYFFSYFIDGFGYAAEALTGRYIGARNEIRLRKAIKLLFTWGFWIAIVFTVAYLLGINWFLTLLTYERSILTAAQPFFYWIVLIPLVSFAAFLWDGIYVGATASRAMRNSMLLSTVLIFFPAYYGLFPLLGNHALWLATLLFLGFRGLFLSIWSRKYILKPIS